MIELMNNAGYEQLEDHETLFPMEVSNGISVENVNKTLIDLVAKLSFDSLTFNTRSRLCALVT